MQKVGGSLLISPGTSPNGIVPQSASSSSSAASLSALSKIPGWRGTLVLSADGAVLQSAGELINMEELGSKFAALAHRIGQYFALQSKKTDGFKRLSIMSWTHIYLMTCSGDAIYVVKKELIPEDSPIHVADSYTVDV